MTEPFGDRTAGAAYRHFFRAKLARMESAEALLREYRPRLLPGIAASALHALMRLAYAVEAGDKHKVAESLGYWATACLPLGAGIGAAPITEEPVGVLVRVAAGPSLAGMTFDGGLLWLAMRNSAAQSAFTPVHDWLDVTPKTIRRMARDSLLVFAATMEFCALHSVTGTHRLRLILPALDPADQTRAIRFFWQAITSVYPKMNCPAPLSPDAARQMRRLPTPTWEAIAAVTCASDDEHDISLVWLARCEEAQRSDHLYRVVAARRVGLLKIWSCDPPSQHRPGPAFFLLSHRPIRSSHPACAASRTDPPRQKLRHEQRRQRPRPGVVERGSFVFQSYVLFPLMTAAENVGFRLKVRRIGRADRDRRVARAWLVVPASPRAGLHSFRMDSNSA